MRYEGFYGFKEADLRSLPCLIGSNPNYSTFFLICDVELDRNWGIMKNVVMN